MKNKICVIGLGYVGLPLAHAFSEKYEVIGFDINKARIEELNSGFDRTLEFHTIFNSLFYFMIKSNQMWKS